MCRLSPASIAASHTIIENREVELESSVYEAVSVCKPGLPILGCLQRQQPLKLLKNRGLGLV